MILTEEEIFKNAPAHNLQLTNGRNHKLPFSSPIFTSFLSHQLLLQVCSTVTNFVAQNDHH